MWTPEAWYGGAKEITLSANYAIIDLANRVFSFSPSASSWVVTLPDARRLRKGWGLYLLVNLHASRTIDVKDNAAGAIVTLNGRQCILLSLRANATAAGSWDGLVRSV